MCVRDSSFLFLSHARSGKREENDAVDIFCKYFISKREDKPELIVNQKSRLSLSFRAEVSL